MTKRPRAIRGSWFAVLAAVCWSVPVIWIPLSILQRAGDPDPPGVLELLLRGGAIALVAAIFGGLGWLFWVPARRRSDAHIRELLEKRQEESVPPTGG